MVAMAFGVVAGPSPKFGSATVNWSYDFPNNPGVTNFMIYFGTTSSNYTSTWSVGGTNLSSVVTNLTRGTTYYFVVTAQATNGLESDYSFPEVSYKVPNKPAAPTSTAVVPQ